jgi:tRNA dimethylallyltransferase
MKQIQKIPLTVEYDLGQVIQNIRDFVSEFPNPVIIVTGPTGSGKTNLAHLISQYLNVRLISADSRQIYKKVDIGSNKVVIHEHTILDGWDTVLAIPTYYWQLDVLDLRKDYSAQKFREEVRAMVKTLHGQKILPLVVGGSVHWIRSLISDSMSPYYKSDDKLYKEIYNKSLEDVQNLYKIYYPDQLLNESDSENKVRLSRAIEYAQLTGNSLYKNTKIFTDENNYLVFEIRIDRFVHREKIRKSVQKRINLGWITEVENIMKEYGEDILDKLGQGYRIIGNYLLNGSKETESELVEKVTIAEMRYAKKQKL